MTMDRLNISGCRVVRSEDLCMHKTLEREGKGIHLLLAKQMFIFAVITMVGRMTVKVHYYFLSALRNTFL